jgi:hypothetical protein
MYMKKHHKGREKDSYNSLLQTDVWDMTPFVIQIVDIVGFDVDTKIAFMKEGNERFGVCN